MICLKHTIKINLVSEFKVTILCIVLSFWIRNIKGDFGLGQVDRDNIERELHCNNLQRVSKQNGAYGNAPF